MLAENIARRSDVYNVNKTTIKIMIQNSESANSKVGYLKNDWKYEPDNDANDKEKEE